MKNIAKGLLVLGILALIASAAPARAENGGKSGDEFVNARASLGADALIRLESATGVVLGPNGTLRVMGAKVISASESEIKASAAIGNSALNFVIKVDSDTRVNGNKKVSVADLKAGDKISFSGVITSSTSSSIAVDAEHVVSRALVGKAALDKNSWKGEIKAINESDHSLTIDLKDGRTVKVVVSGSTAITLDGAVSTLASLDEGEEVMVSGSLSSDGSVITATKVKAVSEDSGDDQDGSGDKDKDERDGGKSGSNSLWNRIVNWLSR